MSKKDKSKIKTIKDLKKEQSKKKEQTKQVKEEIKSFADVSKKLAEISTAVLEIEKNLLGHMNAQATKINAIFWLLKQHKGVTVDQIKGSLKRQTDITNKLLELHHKPSLTVPQKVQMYLAWAKQSKFEVTAEDLGARQWLFSDQSKDHSKEERLKFAHEWGFTDNIGYFFREEEETKEGS